MIVQTMLTTSVGLLALILMTVNGCQGPVVSMRQGRNKISRLPTGYVDYQPSTGLNVILTAPHDGWLTPDFIPDRDAGCWNGTQCIWSHNCGEKSIDRCKANTIKDWRAGNLTTELRQALCARFGACPATVINLLHRSKLDPNREVDEATFGVPLAVEVYDEYHGYITTEREKLGSRMGLYIDLHGHGHSIQRAELGYLVSGSTLDSGNPIDPATTSIHSLADFVGGDFDVLLRGAVSFGAYLENEGFRAVPSPADPGPAGELYFAGGYSTVVHGSRDGGTVDAIQIESPISFLDAASRPDYVRALVETIDRFISTNYPPKP